MAREIAQIPRQVARQMEVSANSYAAIGKLLQSLEPKSLVTCARGSSDCAATYLKYVFETQLGLPVVSMGPSVASIYDHPLHVADTVAFAISQSGRSSDILALQSALGPGGARTIALVNAPRSPVAAISDHVVSVGAGEEMAVPATKSFVCTMVAVAAIFAAFTEDEDLMVGLEALPAQLDAALENQWSSDLLSILDVSSIFVLGRGLTLCIAMEAALKLKETCRIHAEAFSSAEFHHGPAALLDRSIPCIAFVGNDPTQDQMTQTIKMFTELGAGALEFQGDPTRSQGELHPLLAPIVMITRFYQMAERLARYRGLNPDTPSNLSKVTTTL